jgi:hypothetical protein
MRRTRFSIASSDVTIIPASPQPPRFFDGKNENAVAVPSSPAVRHAPSMRRRAPMDWQASSITARPRRCATGRSRSIGAIWPYRCTGRIARVRGPTAASTAAGSRL